MTLVDMEQTQSNNKKNMKIVIIYKTNNSVSKW